MPYRQRLAALAMGAFVVLSLLGGLHRSAQATIATTWAQDFGAASAVTQATAMTTDSAGNSYVAGYFGGATLTFGSTTLSRIGPQDAFIVKLDTSGGIVWAKNFGGSASAITPQGVAIDGSGNVFLTGYFSSGILTTRPLPSPAATTPSSSSSTPAARPPGFAATGLPPETPMDTPSRSMGPATATSPEPSTYP